MKMEYYYFKCDIRCYLGFYSAIEQLLKFLISMLNLIILNFHIY